jgi:hypothetical protein
VKSYDLVWLIHLVGDAHHPLHATSRFTAADPGDNGGNAETVTPANAANESLHAFWDGLLGDRLTPDQAISMAAATSRSGGWGKPTQSVDANMNWTDSIPLVEKEAMLAVLQAVKAARAADDEKGATLQ